LEGVRWIWHAEGNPRADAPAGKRFFRRRFELPGDRRVARALFLGAGDDNFVLHLNGKQMGSGSGWQTATRLDVTEALVLGPNVLAVEATNSMGPAGLLGRLRVEFEEGAPLVVDLDDKTRSVLMGPDGWQLPAFDDAAWTPVAVTASVGETPWGAVKVAPEAGPCPYLRKEFRLDRRIRRARLYATALGVYQLSLNGTPVGDQILAPGWTDYRRRVQYQTYDVTTMVRPGPNALGAILGDGWFAGSLGFDLSRNHFGPGPVRLRARLVVEYADGATELVTTDSSWRGTLRGPIRESDIYGGETYDARLDLTGWDRPGYVGDASGSAAWVPVAVLNDRTPEVNAQIDPPIRVTEELAPRAVTEPRPGVFVFDMGQNMVGWARLKANGPAGSRITMRFAEVLNPNGTVSRENLRLARATDTFILAGRGVETFEPHFTYHGFRYVEVTGFPGRPAGDTILGRVFHSSMRPAGRFESSSELVNRLYRNITWGQRANMMSVPTDCPQRDERLGWMGDAQLFARSSTWNMEMGAFYTKWMRDIVDAQSPEGAFSDVSPRVVDNADGAPAWADAGLIIPWTLYECYGDVRVLARYWGTMQKYVDMLVTANPDLLWLKRRNNDFGDWVPAGEQTNKDLIASAYLAYDLRLLSKMARILGRTEDAQRYGILADRSRDAFNARFLDPEGRYTGDTQTAYAMALGMDLVPAERRGQVGGRLAEAVRRRGSLATGFIGTKYLLPALTDTGNADLAFQLLTSTKYPSWGYMIEKGATTIWELWNSDTAGPAMNSRNHFAFGTVAEWMQRYLGGIDIGPEAPGYRRIIIRPLPGGGITRARTEYDSQYGTVATDWEATDRGLLLKVTVPMNTAATVYLPALASARVMEGGKSVWEGGRYLPGVPGIVAAEATASAVRLDIGGGSYEFRVEQ
jgi:alpha-L-rhamnosidase